MIPPRDTEFVNFTKINFQFLLVFNSGLNSDL